MLFIPLGCIFTLKQTSSLVGVEHNHPFPQISFEDILAKTYQSQFDQWYQQNFFYRNVFLKIRNQIYAWTNFNRFYFGQQMIRGRKMYLYEKGYLSIRLPNHKLQEKQIQLIKKIAEKCSANNINFYFIIAPDKVATYPEYLSKLHTFFYNQTPNHAKEIEKVFKENSIPIYNAQELMFQIKSNDELPPFNKTGTHWNFYGAGKTVQESFKYFNITNIELINIKHSKDAYLTERDISKLLNLPIHYKTNELYYKPTFTAKHPLNVPTVIIGNSFSNEFIHTITLSNLISDPALLQHYENQPLTVENAEKIWKVKNIFFIYTAIAIYDQQNQLYKKIQALLDNAPTT